MAEIISAAGFTAARDLDYAGGGIIIDALTSAIPPVGCYITGGATGGDSFIGRWLYRNHPSAHHVVIIPANKSQVDPWWLYVSDPVEVIPMPAGTSYADRNAEIVRRSGVVYGFPAYPEDDPRSARSGTWQTCRMARRERKLAGWWCVKVPYERRTEDLLGDWYP